MIDELVLKLQDHVPAYVISEFEAWNRGEDGLDSE
jgi:hypothetical protein